MIGRILGATIVIFWLVMTGLLVRLELAPAKSDLMAVPPAHVLRLIFLHEQESDLQIMHAGQRLGSLVLRPRKLPGGRREASFSGGISLRGADGKRQRVSWSGALATGEAFEMQSLVLTSTMTDPPGTFEASVDFPGRTAACAVSIDGYARENLEVSLDEAGLRELLGYLDVDPTILAGVEAQISAPELLARRTTFKVRSDAIEAYQITARQSGVTLIEIYVSQLGQILEARTPFGYSLVSDDLAMIATP